MNYIMRDGEHSEQAMDDACRVLHYFEIRNDKQRLKDVYRCLSGHAYLFKEAAERIGAELRDVEPNPFHN